MEVTDMKSISNKSSSKMLKGNDFVSPKVLSDLRKQEYGNALHRLGNASRSYWNWKT
jgi:hypothetical protein